MNQFSPNQHSPMEARHHYDEGIAQLSAGNEHAARKSFLEAVTLDDSLAIAHYQLGNCLRRSGEQAAAEESLKTAIAKDASLRQAYISLAYLYLSQGKRDLAATALGALASAHPADMPLHRQVAGLLAGMGYHAQAVTFYEACLRRHPRSSQTRMQLGQSLQKLGRFEDAAQAYLAAIESDPNCDAAYLLLAHTRRMQPADSPMLKRFETALSNPKSSEETIKCLHFSLGKMYDDLGNYAEAFAHFHAANDLQHRRAQFDRQALVAYVVATKKVFTQELFQNRSTLNLATPIPVFIVGMLRSGTTLVERILASHPQVFGLGETELVDKLAEELAARLGMPYPDCIASLDNALAASMAVELRAQWPAEARAATHVVDKNPLNFLHLGLIAYTFPGAPILHCVRDPLDTCLSIYFQYFAHPRNNYAYDLDDIGFFFTHYLDLMKHWRTILPVQIHEIRYEELVEGTENATRALLSATGLPWHPDCLEPHKHTDTISTASLWQARQPIYRSSVGRWQHYSAQLESLRKALSVVGAYPTA
ncbi:MAG: sulfotransferase [Gammaproteobacteria bacterium]